MRYLMRLEKFVQQILLARRQKNDQSIKNIIGKIINEDYFKKDYNEVTSKLLFENVDYKTVKNNLSEIYDHLKD